MDRKTVDAAVPTSDVTFIYVDLRNSDDWEKIEWILTQAQLPIPAPDEQTPAPHSGMDRQ